MSKIEQIIILQYFVPLFSTTWFVYWSERRTKVYPCRDDEELTGRVATTFAGIIIFCFIQAVIRSQ